MARKRKNSQQQSTTSDVLDREASRQSSTGGDTVVVCLNRAVGIRFPLSGGRELVIPGNSCHLRGHEMGELNIGGGFSFTVVPRADWEEVSTRYGETALFKSGRIFASRTRADARAEARDKAGTRHGLEPSKGVQTKAVKGD